MTKTCKTCGQTITARFVRGRGVRMFHPNGQMFCAAKSYVPDYKKMGYQCEGEYRAMSPEYRAEISGRVEESLRD